MLLNTGVTLEGDCSKGTLATTTTDCPGRSSRPNRGPAAALGCRGGSAGVQPSRDGHESQEWLSHARSLPCRAALCYLEDLP